MRTDRAEEIAVLALGWMAADDEVLGGFLGVTGAAPEDLRVRAQEPEFLGFVLDYLLADDALTERFLTENGLGPADPFTARQMLPGGDVPNWT